MRPILGGLGRATVALSLLTSLAVVAPAPAWATARSSIAQASAAVAEDGGWDDDEYQWYRQTLVDIAAYDTEPEVRTAAQVALDAGTMAAVKAFVDTGWAKARTLAKQRKAKARKQVQDWAKSAPRGSKVKEWAERALEAGDYEIAEFVAYGHEMAERLDHPVEDTAAEHARIRARVEQMISFGGPTVVAEGTAALGSGDAAMIAEFYRNGYTVANRADFEVRESIRVALEARNSALDEIGAQARTAAAAASARAEILAANIEAMKLLDDALVAMQLGVKASRRADQILEEDKPARGNGQKGRTAELEGLKLEATTQARRGSAAATQSNSIIATVNLASAKLIQTGQSHGVDWAKVTIAAGLAIQAAAAGAETSQHAAEATLADSLALDADANAQLHAKNAAKWLAAARKQADTAKQLAAVAKAQQKVAEDSAARAKTQRELAEAAARRAGDHAGKARDARIVAQSAASNAIDRSGVALTARKDAGVAVAKEQDALERSRNASDQLTASTNHCIATEQQAKAAYAAFQKAHDEATRAGQDADAATADLAVLARKAGDAYDAAKGWAARAQAAADTARAEAEKATAAANQARAAAAKADSEAATARRASDKAEAAARGAVHAAETAMLDAKRTQAEAEAAVEESTQAVFQAEIADYAAGAAAASAELAIDRAGVAEYIAARFATVNADARRVMEAAAEAILVSEERLESAQMHAEEAATAADRATQAAETAVDAVKPAYEAAAQAVRSANEAATAAVNAQKAAVVAANHANGANQAAALATQYENSAWGDANLAAGAAASATNAATMAGNASAEVDRLYKLATEATASIHAFKNSLIATIKEIDDAQSKQNAVVDKQKEYEESFKKGFMTWYNCQNHHDQAACKKVGEFLSDKGKLVLDAGKSYLGNIAKCYDMGDEAACRAALSDTAKIAEFMHQVRLGLWEGVKNFGSSIKLMAECMVPLYAAGQGISKCMENVEQIIASVKMLKEHPLELIHLSEWHNNPGKALGLTLFDIGTMFIPVPGAGQIAAGIAKVATALGQLLAKSMARLSKGVATIGRHTAKLADGVGRPGGVAKLADVTVKIDDPNVTIVDGVAVIDGLAYRLEGAGLRVAGSPDDFFDGVIHIQGGVVKLDGKVAKLENATVKVEKPNGPEAPEICGLPSLARTAVQCLGDQPDGSWVGRENGQELRLGKPYNDEAKRAIYLAKANEPEISPKIRAIAEGIPEGRREGWKFRLKLAESLKRKVVAELKRTPGEEPRVLVGDIKDNIRYTMTFESGDYVSGVVKAMLAMETQGFELFKFKNSWGDTTRDYKGINSVWYDPDTNQYFELQFHTPDSFWLNKAEHPFYEIARTPDMPAEDIAFWKEVSKGMWGNVVTPSGAVALEYPKVQR